MAYGIKSFNVRRICPSGCSGRDRDVSRIMDPGSWKIPPSVWDQKPVDFNAYHCGYCDALWFQGHGQLALYVGRLTLGGDFRRFAEMREVKVPISRLARKKALLLAGRKRDGRKHYRR